MTSPNAQIRDAFIRKNDYYYQRLYQQYRYLVPRGKRVLQVGCATGELLQALEPSVGVGIDTNPELIDAARAKFPGLRFEACEAADLAVHETFDVVILAGILGETADIQKLLIDLRRFCSPDTRIIIEYYSYFWQYLLKGAERLKLKIPQPIQNWLTAYDITNFLQLTGYQVIKADRRILFPVGVPLLSYLFNRILANLPIVNALTLNHFLIARPLMARGEEFSVTVVVPCRNEKGNIAPAVERTPRFGSSLEFIFVEGGSKDGTAEEIERVMALYPEKNIRFLKQTGKGKGDAVRLGFQEAKGEVLMILDADLTVPPEDLPKFYDVLRDNKGEFINGCRLVYPMESQAMRLLNLIANKTFGMFFSWLLGEKFRDTLCGTKVLFRHHYEDLARNRAYFGDFDPFGDFDLIFGASKLNLKILELPIRYKDRQYGSTQIRRFYHGWMLIKMCVFAMRKIKFR